MAVPTTDLQKIQAIHDKLASAKSSPVEYSARELWDLLNDQEKDLFLTYFQDKSIYEFLEEKPEEIDREVQKVENAQAEASEIESLTASRTDTELLVYWMAERENDEQVRAEVAKHVSADKVDYVMLAIKNQQRLRAAEHLKQRLSPEQISVIDNTVEAVNPKSTTSPLVEAYATANKIAEATVYRLERQNNLSLTATEKAQISTLVRMSLASGGCRLDYLPSVVMATAIATQQVRPDWNSPQLPTAKDTPLVQEFAPEKSTQTRSEVTAATSPTYRPFSGDVLAEGGFEESSGSQTKKNEPIYSVALGTAVVADVLVNLPPDQLAKTQREFNQLAMDVENQLCEPQKGQLPILEPDNLARQQNNVAKIQAAIEHNPQVAVIGQSLVPEPSVKELETALKEAGIKLGPSNPKAEYLAGIIKSTDLQGTVSAPAIAIMSRLTPQQRQQVQEHIEAHPSSPIAKFDAQHQVFQQVRFWQSKILGHEIAPVVPGGLNNIPVVGQVFRFPQVIQGRLVQFAGKALGKELVSKMATNEIAKTLVSKGISGLAQKAGTTILLKLTGNAALAATGVGAPIAAILTAVQLGWTALKGLIKPIVGDVKARDVITAPLLMGGMLAGFIPTMVVTGTAIATSVITTTVISVIIGIILYLTSFTMAPILTTMVHFGSGFGVLGGGLSTYTGPITSGCSGQWPVSHGSIIQGPHGWFSHLHVEGVDMTSAVGTPVFSITSGTVKSAGWGGVYGNLLVISSTSPGGGAYDLWYGHLSAIQVTTGQTVSLGQQVALTGMTSSNPDYQNPHLHLEYRGITYNSCPAGATQVPDGCYLSTCGSIRW